MISRYLFLLVAVMATSSDPGSSGTDAPMNGLLILKDGELSEQPRALNGYWEFYPNELIGSAEMNSKPSKSFIEVPFWWTEEEGKPNIQFATYRLKVIHSKTKTSSLAITMPDVYCAYDLWVNGHKLGYNGIVGKTKDDSKPQWKPETYIFTAEPDSLEIILHVSNFYHHRTGIHDPILLGQADQLVQHKNRIETTNLFLLLGLGILAIIAFTLYLRSKNIALILYVLLCLSWMLRSAFSNHYQIVQWFPDINWYFSARTEYISIYLTTLFGSLLVGSLFPRDVNNVFRLFFIITCGCFTLFTLFATPLIFTTYVQLYLGLSTILLLSILVIIIKAYTESREGAGFIMISALMGVSIFGYVILSYEGIFKLNEIVFNIGFLIQFVITLIAVIRRIHKMKTTEDYDMMTFDQATRKR
ncbi:MAG TPA: 7TM diverse intracellular signaling domain-containing protein [Chryseolinea sp.]|nr:7TM diverse intracellular signaling domain-containing protein [Chryseolinea sp.]HPM31089.1 7TM diverse intracellular signaling domain-containing protein [Chryseolinea sp.]